MVCSCMASELVVRAMPKIECSGDVAEMTANAIACMAESTVQQIAITCINDYSQPCHCVCLHGS